MNTIINHDEFLAAIQLKKKVRLNFISKDGVKNIRVCAPMDFGTTRRHADGYDRYHLWDYDSPTKPHPLLLLAEEIVSIEDANEDFDPAEFINWDTRRSAWHIPRDWVNFLKLTDEGLDIC